MLSTIVSVLFMVLANFHTTLSQENCDPRPLLIAHEGYRECMYIADNGFKTIGIGFNLEASHSKTMVIAVGADYNKIINGPATPFNKPCDCSSVVCLTSKQIDLLFNQTLMSAQKEASLSLDSFFSLCCPAQNAISDMVYNIGGPAFKSLSMFLEFLSQNNWAAAADDLMLSAYCGNPSTRGRCLEDAGYIRMGCPCFGMFGMQCTAQSACCNYNTKCCPYVVQFNSFYKKNLTETWCCPIKDGICCSTGQHCCPTKFPVCCNPPNEHCCSQSYPVCCPGNHCCPTNYPKCASGGYCQAENGDMIKALSRGPTMSTGPKNKPWGIPWK